MLQTCPAAADVLNWGVQEMSASCSSRRSHYAAPACRILWRAIGSERPTFSDAAVERRKKTPAERHGPAQAGLLSSRPRTPERCFTESTTNAGRGCNACAVETDLSWARHTR